MASTTRAAGQCPKCGGDALACRYNFFDRGDLQVYSWEHRCGNCGWRQTMASRSDEPADKQLPEPSKCPMCGRSGS